MYGKESEDMGEDEGEVVGSVGEEEDEVSQEALGHTVYIVQKVAMKKAREGDGTREGDRIPRVIIFFKLLAFD